MKAESTIRRQLKKLREVVDHGDNVESRVAYAMEAALRYVLYTHSPALDLQEEARKNAQILKDEATLTRAMR